MGRVNVNDVDKYNTGGSLGGFLQLKDDGDKARVRFMLEDIEDLNDYTYVVHNVKKDKKDKYGTDINCLREYDDPVDACPLCAAGIKQQIKVFVPIYNVDEDCVQIWTRGKTFISKLAGLMRRYEDFPSQIFEIERNGKKGDQKTTYEIFPDEEDEISLDDLPEIPDVEAMALKNKSEDDMNYYLEEGEFPPEDDDEDDDDEPVRRRSPKKSRKSRDEDEEDVRPRKKKSRHVEEDEDDDDEEEKPVRKKTGKKKRRRNDEDEF